MLEITKTELYFCSITALPVILFIFYSLFLFVHPYHEGERKAIRHRAI